MFLQQLLDLQNARILVAITVETRCHKHDVNNAYVLRLMVEIYNKISLYIYTRRRTSFLMNVSQFTKFWVITVVTMNTSDHV